MGVSKAGRIGALTNIREPHLMRDDAKSRGDLVINWLNAESDTASDIAKNNVANRDITNYAAALKLSANLYNGYNLLFGDVTNLVSFNSRHHTLQALSAGVYGMSNATLDTPWPKLRKGKQLLQGYCERKEQSVDALFDLLSSRVQAPDNELPNTGVSLDWERRLSALFIVSEEYGTRSSTILRMNNDQQINWIERSFNHAGDVTSQQHYQWHISDNS